MADEPVLTPLETMAREKARLLAEAAEKQAAAAIVDRDMAEIQRVSAVLAKYNMGVTTLASDPSKSEPHETFDGTINGLISAYKSHPQSPFQKLRYKTRTSYEYFFVALVQDLGPEQIDTIDAEKVAQLHAKWANSGRLPMATAVVGTLRRIMTCGSQVLKDRACRELRFTL